MSKWALIDPLMSVAIYARNIIVGRQLDLRPFCVEKSLEVTGVEIAGRKMAVVTVYRSPDGDFDIFMNNFDHCLTNLTACDRFLVIGGDFNIHMNTDSADESVQFKNLYCVPMDSTSPR